MPELVHNQHRAVQWGGRAAMGALALVLLVLAGCGQTANGSRAAPTPTPRPTSTPSPLPTPILSVLHASGPPVQGTPPRWYTSTLPKGFGPVFHVSSLTVAQGDGLTAYACGGLPSNSPAHPEVLATYDGAHTWTRGADIPANWLYCAWLTVDALDPSFVEAEAGYGATGSHAISRDGGSHGR